jgi:hypothetical protein
MHSSKQSDWILTLFPGYSPTDLIWISPKIEQYEEGEAEHT